ncbi:MAG: PAS domain-containing sensor histidine kinase [Proteobacteria bacterium]|nr:MAG: PAS domain-containing sensor histidine kinase [Pseudomonadota bacterium]
MRKSWLHYVLLLAFGFVLLGLIGYAIGQPAWTLFAGVSAYLVWTLAQVVRLHAWLARRGTSFQPPESLGLWGDLFDGIHSLQVRHVRATERMKSFIHRIQESANSLKDGVVITDEIGRIEWWNVAASKLLGFEHPADKGQRVYNLIRQPEFRRYFEAKDYGSPFEQPSSLSPHIRLKYMISLFGDGDRLIIVQDATRIHSLEQMRKDFISNVSHELRTPLTVISGYLETINDNSDQLPEKWHRAFKTMARQSTRMESLISDLLLLAKFETSDVRNNQKLVNMKQVIEGIRQDALAINQEKRHSITFEVEAEDIMGDMQQVRSALSNLVFNAVKYTPPGGHIVIGWIKKPGGAYFTVKDNGVGFDPIHIPRLTERFYRVDPGRNSKEGGTGLGLAIVKHVLINHDGELKICSTPGEGSEFTCFFPNSRYVDDSRTRIAV